MPAANTSPPAPQLQRDDGAEARGAGNPPGPAEHLAGPQGSTGTAEAQQGDGTEQQAGPARVLTPSSLKLDSRVLLAHTSSLWLSNAAFCILLLGKLTTLDASWWLIFLPQFVGHALHIPLLVWVIATVKQRVEQQLGPPPPATASLTLHAHYSALKAVARRSHIIDNVDALLDSCALLAVKVQFAHYLDNGTFADVSLRVVFTPIWVVWGITFLLVCLKHRRERVIGSQRDLTYIFLLMVAFKVDGQSSFPWQVVFIIPWIWLCGVMLLGLVVAVSLTCARGRARLRDLLIPIGFMLLLFSTGAPQFAFCNRLVAYLAGDTDVTMQSILIPATVGWLAMWLSSVVLCLGLHKRERARAALLASGAVWTAHEALARHLQPALREEEQQRVDNMTEEEVVKLAQQYMRTKGVAAPTSLLRVAPSLFKRPNAADSLAPASKGAATPPAPTTVALAGGAGDKPPTAAAAAKPQHVVVELPPPSAPSDPLTGGALPAADPADVHPQETPQGPQGSAVSGGAVAAGPREQQQQQQGAEAQGGPLGGEGQGQVPVSSPLRPGLLQASPGLAELLGMGGGIAEDADDTCVICFDAQASCVLLDCGHGGFCTRCAHVLMVRPPNCCPSCRRPIEQVVQLDHVGGVGQLCTVKRRPLPPSESPSS